MKLVTLILLALSFTACSKVWVKNEMQPDYSYLVTASGNSFASWNETEETAKERARRICPNGYTQRSSATDTADAGGTKPIVELVVVCKK